MLVGRPSRATQREDRKRRGHPVPPSQRRMGRRGLLRFCGIGNPSGRAVAADPFMRASDDSRFSAAGSTSPGCALPLARSPLADARRHRRWFLMGIRVSYGTHKHLSRGRTPPFSPGAVGCPD